MELQLQEEMLQQTEWRAEEAMQLAEVAMNERDDLQNKLNRLLLAEQEGNTDSHSQLLKQVRQQDGAHIPPPSPGEEERTEGGRAWGGGG